MHFPNEKFLSLVTEVCTALPESLDYSDSDQLGETRQALADENCDAEIETIGQSTEGRPIELLRIGAGPIPLLFIGVPHPGEVVGTLTIEHLARNFCASKALREEFEQCTLLFVQVSDPDGYALNEPWLKLEHTPTNHTLYHYRPAFSEQPTSNFPFKYRHWEFDDPCPECKALLKLLDEHLPVYVNEMHNADLENCFATFSLQEPELVTHLEALSSSIGVEFDGLLSPYTQAAFYDRQAAKDPKFAPTRSKRTSGAGTYDHLSRVRPGSHWFNFEFPYWRSDRRNDETDTGCSRGEIRVESLAIQEAAHEFMEEGLLELKDRYSTANHPGVHRLFRAVDSGPRRRSFDGARESIESDPKNKENASISFVWQEKAFGMYYFMRAVGMFWRAAEILREQEMADEIRGMIVRGLAYLEEDYEIIPVRDLVRIQLSSALVSMKQSVHQLLNFPLH